MAGVAQVIRLEPGAKYVLHAHNLYLQVAVDSPLALVAWTSLVGMLVHGTLDAVTWIIGRGAFVPWAVIGMLIALNGRPEPESGGAEGQKSRGAGERG